MRSVRLVASDMDHTLLDGQGAFPPGFLDDLRRLGEAGIVFVAASGRPLYTLRRMFPESDHIAFISDNGGTVTHRGEVLFQSLVPTVDARFATASNEEHGVAQTIRELLAAHEDSQ